MDSQANDLDPRFLFVYGTLRKDLGSRQGDGVPVGLGTTSGIMFDLGAFPAVIPSAEADEAIFRLRGELQSFEHLTDDEWRRTLRNFDRYEGVPSLYVRAKTLVTLDEPDEDGDLVYYESWIYHFANTDRLEGQLAIGGMADWADRVAARRASRLSAG